MLALLKTHIPLFLIQDQPTLLNPLPMCLPGANIRLAAPRIRIGLLVTLTARNIAVIAVSAVVRTTIIMGILDTPAVMGILDPPAVMGILDTPVVMGILDTPVVMGILNPPVVMGSLDTPVVM